ncbi:unnamed protein product [Trichobilharzia szidati]|nr:unnamed protein product [Trichobilharzia szidati]
MIIREQRLPKFSLKTSSFICFLIGFPITLITVNMILVTKREFPHLQNIYQNIDGKLSEICELFLHTIPNQTFAKQFEHYSTENHHLLNKWTPMSNCKFPLNTLKYSFWSSEEEINFPIGFAFAVYEDIDRIARLLRLLYRPHNLYCIHVDRSTSDEFYQSVIHLASCFGSNVQVINRSQSITVKWGYFSVLDSFLKCTQLMLNNTEVDWKYVLNTNGKELPLRTNWELVKALKALNGANVIGGTMKNGPKGRIPKRKPSFNVTWVKGSFLVALRREFVQYIHTNPKPIELLNILKGEEHLRKIPDEMFFSTLAYNPQLNAPGGCKEFHSPKDNDPSTRFVSRYVVWKPKYCATGKRYHTICMLGVQHLYNLSRSEEFFANKFYTGFYDTAYDCLEYWILKKMKNEYLTGRVDATFNVQFYSELYCSRNHN